MHFTSLSSQFRRAIPTRSLIWLERPRQCHRWATPEKSSMYPNRLRRTDENVGSTSHRGQTCNTLHLGGKKSGEEEGGIGGEDDHRRPHPHRWLETGPKIRSQNNPSLIGRCVLYSTVSGFSTLPTTLSVESIRSAQRRICSGEAIPISMRSSRVHPVSPSWAVNGSLTQVEGRGSTLATPVVEAVEDRKMASSLSTALARSSRKDTLASPWALPWVVPKVGVTGSRPLSSSMDPLNWMEGRGVSWRAFSYDALTMRCLANRSSIFFSSHFSTPIFSKKTLNEFFL